MLSKFTSIYVINLPDRKDRRAEIEAQLNRFGLTFNSPNVHLFPGVRPADKGGFESIGARGCFLSHLGVLREARGKQNVLILEDDLDFSDNVADFAMPEEWGIFYGGARHSLVSHGSFAVASPADSIECAHFVAFNGPDIPRVATFLESLLTREPGDPEGGPMHVDGAYNVFRARHPEVKTVVATPDLGHQRSSKSDIAPRQWYDKGVFLPLAAFARRVRRAAKSRA